MKNKQAIMNRITELIYVKVEVQKMEGVSQAIRNEVSDDLDNKIREHIVFKDNDFEVISEPEEKPKATRYCDECEEEKDARGFWMHKKSHEKSEMVDCPHCDGSYTEEGLPVHIGRAHKDINGSSDKNRPKIKVKVKTKKSLNEIILDYIRDNQPVRPTDIFENITFNGYKGKSHRDFKNSLNYLINTEFVVEDDKNLSINSPDQFREDPEELPASARRLYEQYIVQE